MLAAFKPPARIVRRVAAISRAESQLTVLPVPPNRAGSCASTSRRTSGSKSSIRRRSVVLPSPHGLDHRSGPPVSIPAILRTLVAVQLRDIQPDLVHRFAQRPRPAGPRRRRPSSRSADIRRRSPLPSRRVNAARAARPEHEPERARAKARGQLRILGTRDPADLDEELLHCRSSFSRSRERLPRIVCRHEPLANQKRVVAGLPELRRSPASSVRSRPRRPRRPESARPPDG